jgi:hypothetical protein
MGRGAAFLFRDRDRILVRSSWSRSESSVGQVLSTPRSPSHVEMASGTIRVECLEHVIAFGEWDPRRLLSVFIEHYHRTRTSFSRQSRSGSAADSGPRRGACSLAT